MSGRVLLAKGNRLVSLDSSSEFTGFSRRCGCGTVLSVSEYGGFLTILYSVRWCCLWCASRPASPLNSVRIRKIEEQPLLIDWVFSARLYRKVRMLLESPLAGKALAALLSALSLFIRYYK
mgnify:CR=1 FL=1|jgi:hypothetical protein